MKSILAGVVLWSAGVFAQPLTQPPTPESHFGHPMGVDRELLDWDKVVSYYQELSKTSDKIRVQELGKTAEGRPFIAATIASAATLRNLDRYRQIQAKLADPRSTTPAEAARLILEGKTVVLITCSIHATEVASTHSAIQFVYNLLTEDTPKYRAILDNLIIILVPSQNPDGVDIVTRWYRKTLDTAYEGTSPPELYQKYLGHDNNRDWYIFTQPEQRITAQLENDWHPQIVYDVHQQGSYASRMFVPPWLSPIDPNVDRDAGAGGELSGAGHGGGFDRGGEKRRGDQRALRFLGASAPIHRLPRGYSHFERSRQRVARQSADGAAGSDSNQRAWATTRASEAGIIWSRGKAGHGGSATSSTIN